MTGVTRAATRRAVVLAGTGLGTGLLATACGAATSDAPAESRPAESRPAALKSGITLQWGIATGQTREELRRRQVELFERQFPGIKVELIVGGSSVDKIKAGMAAGEPMDLIRITTTQYAGFAQQGAVLALDGLIRRDRYDLKDFYPQAISQWQWRGKQWAMPFLGTLTQYVNLELVEQTGARRPPTTWKDPTWNWEAFLEFGRKVARREGDRVVRWGYTGTHDNQRYFLPWVWTNGGDLFDKDLKQVTIGEPPALEALQFLADLIHKHRVSPTPAELREIGGSSRPFREGKSAIMSASVNAVASNRQVPGLRWTLTTLPRGRKGVANGGGGVGWFITTGGRYHDETWELLKVVESFESDKLTALMGEAPPGRRSVGRDSEFLNPKEAPGADMKVVAESLEVALRTDTVLIQGEEIFKLVSDELAPVWEGQRAAREAVEAIKQKVTPMLALERQ